MKKYLLLFLLFFLIGPIVYAVSCNPDSIVVENIALENKTDGVIENKEASVEGRKVKLDLDLSYVGDTIVYKMLVKNTSSEDFVLNDSKLKENSNYINYTFKTDDNTNIVEANSSKVIYLTVKYGERVPDEELVNGIYKSSNTMQIDLSSGNDISVPDTIKNFSMIIVIIIAIICVIIAIIAVKRKNTIYMLLVALGLLIILPETVNALCKCEIQIESSIEIIDYYTGVIYRYSPVKAEKEQNINYSWCFEDKNNNETYNSCLQYEEYDGYFKTYGFYTEEECEEESYRWCYVKSDESWDSCVDDQFGYTDEHSCVSAKNNDVANGYATEGEYTCSREKFGSCIKANISAVGFYTKNARDIESNVYLKHDIENNIIKNSYVCFRTDKEYCIQGGINETNDSQMPIYNSNIEVMNGTNNYFYSCDTYDNDNYSTYSCGRDFFEETEKEVSSASFTSKGQAVAYEYDDTRDWDYSCCDIYEDGSSNCNDRCLIMTG